MRLYFVCLKNIILILLTKNGVTLQNTNLFLFLDGTKPKQNIYIQI